MMFLLQIESLQLENVVFSTANHVKALPRKWFNYFYACNVIPEWFIITFSFGERVKFDLKEIEIIILHFLYCIYIGGYCIDFKILNPLFFVVLFWCSFLVLSLCYTNYRNLWKAVFKKNPKMSPSSFTAIAIIQLKFN